MKNKITWSLSLLVFNDVCIELITNTEYGEHICGMKLVDLKRMKSTLKGTDTKACASDDVAYM